MFFLVLRYCMFLTIATVMKKIVLGRIAELKREKKFSVVDDNDDIGDCINKGEVKLLL